MPAAPPLFSCGGVLSAADRHTVVPARDTDIAADALANILLAALVDLLRQKRIGDRGARPTDQIQDAAFDLRNHAVRRGEAPHADDGLPGNLFDELYDRLVAAFAGESRRRAVSWARVHLDVPKIRHISQQLDDFMRFGGSALA